MHNLAIPAGLTLVLASTLSATAQQPPSTQPSAQGGLGPTIRLLNAGASPRTLRLAPRQGATGVIDLTMKITAKRTVDGALTPEPPSPGVLMSFKTVVTEIDGDRIGYTFECIKGDLVEDQEVPAQIREMLRGGITMVAGLRGTGVISDRGVSLGATVTRTPGMDQALLGHAMAIERLLGQVTTPLPAEPVGVGGSWEATNTIDEDGLTVQETITCTLTAMDGKAVEIDTEIRRQADPQPVRDPNIPAGASANLTAYAFAGTGRAVLRLDELHPIEGAVNVTADSTVQMAFGGVHHEVTMNVTVATELKRGG